MHAASGNLASRVARPGGRPSLLLDFVRGGSLSRAVVRGDATIGFARALAAYDTGPDGALTLFGAGVARVGPRGFLIEGAATNAALHASDATQAAWEKSGLAAAKDATGPDGVANGASTLTATDANGTALQPVTLGSAARTFSVYMRRKAGIGDVGITDNNGTDWTATAPTPAWQRFTITRTQANPVVGIRLATQGDAVEMWGAQIEAGGFATSPVPTTTVPVTRPVDMATITGLSTARWFDAAQGTFLFEIDTLPIAADANGSTNRFLIDLWNGSDNTHQNFVSTELQFVTSGSLTRIGPYTAVTAPKMAYAYATDNAALHNNGALVGSPLTSLLVPPGLITAYLGLRGTDNLRVISTYLKRLVYYPRRLSNDRLQAFTQ